MKTDMIKFEFNLIKVKKLIDFQEGLYIRKNKIILEIYNLN